MYSDKLSHLFFFISTSSVSNHLFVQFTNYSDDILIKLLFSEENQIFIRVPNVSYDVAVKYQRHIKTLQLSK